MGDIRKPGLDGLAEAIVQQAARDLRKRTETLHAQELLAELLRGVGRPSLAPQLVKS